MMDSILFQVLLFLGILCTTSLGNIRVCVCELENSCSSCTSNFTDLANISLPMDNFVIQFCSSEFHLDSVLRVEDKHNVTIQGMPTRLECSGFESGMSIRNVTDFIIRDVTFVSCGNKYENNKTIENDKAMEKDKAFRTGVHILSCTGIVMERVSLINSTGSGVTMFDNGGRVKIIGCTFQGSKDNGYTDSLERGGSGLHIVLSYCGPRELTKSATDREDCQSAPINGSSYLITWCSFNNNYAGPTTSVKEDKYLAEGFKRGGGLSIILDENASFNVMEVTNCNFTQNIALWGGGLYVAAVGNANNNVVSVVQCMFNKNSCSFHSGGAVSVGYQESNSGHPQNNTIAVKNCTLEENEAITGGGATIYSSWSREMKPNKILFVGCTWISNTAELGSALDITPEVWRSYVYNKDTEIVFEDCGFCLNKLTSSTEGHRSHPKGAGAFLSNGYHIQFKGNTVFDWNSDSALHLTSTEVEFLDNSNTVFTNNNGFNGGGIHMVGFSVLILNDDSRVIFTNNTALNSGGAIYHNSYDVRDYFASHSCFIRYNGRKNLSDRNITFIFQNNSVNQGSQNRSSRDEDSGENGHSIFTSTTIPCCKDQNYTDANNIFSSYVTNFILGDEKSYDISTFGSQVIVNKMVNAIPGKRFKLPLTTLNDLEEEVIYPYLVSVTGSSVSVDGEYTHLSNKYIRFYGEPGARADITLQSTGTRTIVITFQVHMQECPPGFFHDRDKVRGKCVCSFETNGRFSAIQSCDNEAFRANLNPSYWVGYAGMRESGFGKEIDFQHCICPFGHCLNDNLQNDYVTAPHTLPSDTSLEKLDEIICGKSRTGVLCSKCRDGYAANYHESKYECKEVHDNCKWGWLLYLVSEILPVTIFFISVMLFNINFIDGSINGLILYVQLTDTMLIKGNRYILFPEYSFIGLQIYRCVTRIFNLNFFAIDSWSFCLWRQATTLDLLAFKYITIVYASTLVVALIVVFKFCHSRKLNSLLVKIKGGSASTTKSDIIRGVSSFMVICYSECMRVSLQILTPIRIYGTENTVIAAFYSGGLNYFRGRHLIYAVPALLIVLILGILPPLILIAYPLCYKILACFKVGETKFERVLCKCVPLERLKPFFDSFQSSYKDKYRFFSGLYFLYRLVTLLAFAFTSDLKHYYTIVQVQFTVVLMGHALCQPYKKQWHNNVDTLFFTNLSIINALSLFNFIQTRDITTSHMMVNITSTVQVLFLYLPLFYIAVNAIRKIVTKLKARKFKILSKMRNRSATQLSDYHRLSSGFPLNAAEERIDDSLT